MQKYSEIYETIKTMGEDKKIVITAKDETEFYQVHKSLAHYLSIRHKGIFKINTDKNGMNIIITRKRKMRNGR